MIGTGNENYLTKHKRLYTAEDKRPTIQIQNFVKVFVYCISARLNIQYPMLFKLINKRTARETHCGVLEFVADEGHIYLPYWV